MLKTTKQIRCVKYFDIIVSDTINVEKGLGQELSKPDKHSKNNMVSQSLNLRTRRKMLRVSYNFIKMRYFWLYSYKGNCCIKMYFCRKILQYLGTRRATYYNQKNKTLHVDYVIRGERYESLILIIEIKRSAPIGELYIARQAAVSKIHSAMWITNLR